MTAGDDTPAFSLKRWSRRKLAAARESAQPRVSDAAPASARVPDPATPAAATLAAPTPGPAVPPREEPAALPPVDSLTIDSDFTGFLRPDVAEGLKRQALKQLFRDPHFNVMDGLDVYIDDYSKPDPIPPELVRELVQGRYIFDPPATRVNERGEVEDVPPDEIASTSLGAPAQGVAAPAQTDGVPTQADSDRATTQAGPVRLQESKPHTPPAVDCPTPAFAPDANKPPPA